MRCRGHKTILRGERSPVLHLPRLLYNRPYSAHDSRFPGVIHSADNNRILLRLQRSVGHSIS